MNIYTAFRGLGNVMMDMTETLFSGKPSPRKEIIFEVSGSVRLPTIRSVDYKLMGDMLFNIAKSV